MTIHSTFGKLAFSLALAGTFLFPGLDARAANDTTDTLNFVNYRDVRDLIHLTCMPVRCMPRK